MMGTSLKRSLVQSAAAVACVIMLSLSPASAMTVYDPTNYAQNLLQAARALEQIHNQIQQIEQQARMLTKNPLQLSPELSESIGAARELFDAAKGIAFEMDRVSDDLRTLYPETWDDFELDQIGARTKVKVVKNKVAPPFKLAEFDIIFGKGISKSGDVLDNAVARNIVTKAGTYYNYNDTRLGQGRDNAREFLENNPEILAEIEGLVRTKLTPPKVTESPVALAQVE